MWWEFGEKLAWLLTPITTILPARFVCQCEQRRLFCNQLGEAFWRWRDADGYKATRKRFSSVTRFWLSQRLMVPADLQEVLQLAGLRLSERTIERWLGEEEWAASIVYSGVRRYGVKAA